MAKFDLEQALAGWKKTLRRNPALEDGQAAELEAGLRDEIEELIAGGSDPETAFCAALAAMGSAGDAGPEFYKARRTRRSRRPPWQAPRFVPALVWSYFQVAWRKIRRQKGYAFINIAGLALGLACSILMILWISQERRFDRFHVNRDSIYRLVQETRNETSTILDARAATPTGPAVQAELPEVAEFCRYRTNNSYGVLRGDNILFDAVIGIADPNFFTMFTFPFIKGDPRTALKEPKSIVLTESMARTLFGGEDPLGKTVNVGFEPFAVTGLIRDVPETSHLHFACVIPIINMREYHHIDFANWNSMYFNCYVQLKPGAVPAETAAKMSGILQKNLAKADVFLRLQPFRDIHLKSDFVFDLDNYAQASASTLTLFSTAAAVILLLACINFMNLATARSANRAKEVGMRKVTGARRSDLVKQFLGESVVLAFLGLGLALLILWAILPSFNALSGRSLFLGSLFKPGLLSAVIGVTVFSGLLAGGYPAVYLASFEPARVLKGSIIGRGRGHASLRKGLIVLQFGLTAFFIFGTIAVDKQLRFIRAKNLGFDAQQVVVTSISGSGLKDALLADPRIQSASQSMAPGSALRAAAEVSWEGKTPGNNAQFFPYKVDPDFLVIFRAEMAEGRFFARETASDRTEAAVVNETASRVLGPGSAVGKRISMTDLSIQGRMETRTYTVIGVMRDFHQDSLHHAIEPIIFTNNGEEGPWLNLRINSIVVKNAIPFIEKTWKSFNRFPSRPFRYSFLDERIDSFYKQDRRTRSILGIFTVLALFTAGLGLVGLAAFIAEKKTKEIGIRKVLGASTGGIVVMQAREFLAWILAANVIALPVAYLAAGSWLRGFAYRVNPGIAPALISAAVSLLIALLSVIFKSVQAARTNPAQSLRFE